MYQKGSAISGSNSKTGQRFKDQVSKFKSSKGFSKNGWGVRSLSGSTQNELAKSAGRQGPIYTEGREITRHR